MEAVRPFPGLPDQPPPPRPRPLRRERVEALRQGAEGGDRLVGPLALMASSATCRALCSAEPAACFFGPRPSPASLLSEIYMALAIDEAANQA
jgi:hypothetical protein